MGLLIDTTLDFTQPEVPPNYPSEGASLYFIDGDGLHVITSDSDSTVLTTDERGRGVWYTAETGTPAAPSVTTSPLYPYRDAIEVGDYIIREADGEVFQMRAGGGTPGNISPPYPTDLGFSTQYGGGNPVTNTICRAWEKSTATTLATTNTLIKLDTIEDDPGGNFNITTHLYTCPVAGYYRVDASVNLYNAGVAQTVTASIGRNAGASESAQINYDTIAAAASLIRNGSVLMKCAAGDTIGLYGNSTSGTVEAYAGQDNWTEMGVSLLAPLTSAPVQPNTAARAYRSASFAMATSGWQKIPVDTVATGSDPGGHYDVTTNHRYNVSAPGWSLVSGSISIVATAVGTINASSIYYNGALHSQGGASQQDIAGAGNNYPVSDLIYCLAGDYLELWGYSNAAATLGGGTTQSYLSVVKVDQPSQLQVANGAWQTPTLLNSWADSGSPYPNAQYMKDALGFVHLRGCITSGTSGSTAFVLPAGYRPAATGRWTYSPASSYMTMIAVDASGNVTLTGTAPAPSLEVVTFLAEN